MTEERIEEKLLNLGYTKVRSITEGIYFLYHMAEGEASIVTFFHMVHGMKLTLAQYQHIIDQIKNNIRQQGCERIRLLSLIFTDVTNDAREFCLDEDVHWLIDINAKQLILYENQPSDYMGLRGVIEDSLRIEQEHIENYESGSIGDDHREQSNHPSQITLNTFVNTIIIILNIIVHIIIHVSGLFGGRDKLLSEGELSWQIVGQTGEYYRLLTAMFIHYDFSHLFNNMLVLFFVGDKLEKSIGKRKYLVVYFGSGILAGIASMGYNMFQHNEVVSVGASGAIFGVVGAMLYVLIANKGRVEDMTSRQMLFFIVFSLYGGFTSVNVDNAAHVGGFLAGILVAVLVYRRPKHFQSNELS